MGNSSADILIESERIALNFVHQVYLDIELKRMLLSFLIKYMKAHSKPWSTEPLLRQWRFCGVASYAFCNSFRTTK